MLPLHFTYCRRPSDSKLTQISGSAPTRRQKSTNSPVPIWLDSIAAPQQVDHRRARLARPDAFAPAIEIREDAAPAHHRRRELRGDRHHVVAPAIRQVVPGRFDGAVGRAERLHELHVEIGRQLEQAAPDRRGWRRCLAEQLHSARTRRRETCRPLPQPRRLSRTLSEMFVSPRVRPLSRVWTDRRANLDRIDLPIPRRTVSRLRRCSSVSAGLSSCRNVQKLS